MNKTLIDFHSHILPGVDDGSKNTQMSLELLRRQWEQGVGHVVLTPHFYAEHDTPEHFLRKRDEAMACLQAAVNQEQGMPQLYLGAEVAYFRGISECDDLPRLCIHDTKYVLVELPMVHWDDRVYTELTEIRHKQGLTPIIAHVDRYLPRFGAKKMLTRLAQLPVLIQANAEAFTQRSSAALMLWMLGRGNLHMLGSDTHDLTERVPNLEKAVEMIRQKLGDKEFERFNELGESLLNVPIHL